MGFMGFSKSYLPVRFAALALVGAFVASLGVVALPSEAQARRSNVWSVEFKCADDQGATNKIQLDSIFDANEFFIQTLVNIHNPTERTVKFKKKVVVALRQHLISGDDIPRKNVSKKVSETLGSNESLALDCEDIRKVFETANRDFHAQSTSNLVEGFVVIESEKGRRIPDLAVCANYMLVAEQLAGTNSVSPTGLSLHNQCYKPIRVRFRSKF